MTPTQKRLVEAMKDAVSSREWVVVPGCHVTTIRYSVRGRKTPTRIKDYGWWGGGTYNSHVFITVITGKPWSIILRVGTCPWVEARDTVITFKRAFEILANPSGVFEIGDN